MKNRIREIRNALGYSQSDFAKKISVSRSAICKIESGENSPSEQTIKIICSEFNVNEDWLRNGTGEMKKPINTDYEAITTLIGENDTKAKQAIIDYWKLSEADKELFWNFIDRFLKGKA